jgi:hypothetical protein
VYEELGEKVFAGDSSVGEGPDGDDRKEPLKNLWERDVQLYFTGQLAGE